MTAGRSWRSATVPLISQKFGHVSLQDRQFLKVLSQGLHIFQRSATMRTSPKPYLDLFINVIRHRPASSRVPGLASGLAGFFDPLPLRTPKRRARRPVLLLQLRHPALQAPHFLAHLLQSFLHPHHQLYERRGLLFLELLQHLSLQRTARIHPYPDALLTKKVQIFRKYFCPSALLAG